MVADLESPELARHVDNKLCCFDVDQCQNNIGLMCYVYCDFANACA